MSSTVRKCSTSPASALYPSVVIHSVTRRHLSVSPLARLTLATARGFWNSSPRSDLKRRLAEPLLERPSWSRVFPMQPKKRIQGNVGASRIRLIQAAPLAKSPCRDVVAFVCNQFHSLSPTFVFCLPITDLRVDVAIGNLTICPSTANILPRHLVSATRHSTNLCNEYHGAVSNLQSRILSRCRRRRS